MRFDVFTLFPGIFSGPLTESILKRAIEQGLISVELHDIRDWTTDRHRSADDYPYGGGPGMVMMAPPIVTGVEEILGKSHDVPILVLSPSGEVFNQRMAGELARHERLVLICGRYEGIDERVFDILGARPVSIGDFVLTGGELGAAVMVDAISRLVPGVIDAESLADESHTSGLLEYPHYTRPVEYRAHAVPEILLSGHHARIQDWRRQQMLLRTAERRPDLLGKIELTETDRKLLLAARPTGAKTDLPGNSE